MMSNIFPKLYNEKIKKERQEYEERMLLMRRESDEQEVVLSGWINTHAKKASHKDYARWLEGYAKRGMTPTHFYDYTLSGRNFYLLCKNTSSALPVGFGSWSVSLIVPEQYDIPKQKEFTHNNVYYMKDFSHDGHFVPCYQNT